jgi:hypothetical protein
MSRVPGCPWCQPAPVFPTVLGVILMQLYLFILTVLGHCAIKGYPKVPQWPIIQIIYNELYKMKGKNMYLSNFKLLTSSLTYLDVYSLFCFRLCSLQHVSNAVEPGHFTKCPIPVRNSDIYKLPSTGSFDPIGEIE